MTTIYTPEYDQELHKEWQRLLNGDPLTPGIVRPEIVQCWNQCMKSQLNPHVLETSPFSEKEFEDLLFANQLMCNIARPFVNSIAQNIPGPASIVSLLDKNCLPLIRVSEAIPRDYDEYLQTHNLLPGMKADLKNCPGFPELYLCLKTKKPQYCYGEENFFSFSKDWMCVAAPILDHEGNLQGVLSISDTKDNYDRQSMGLVIAAAKAIENEMKMTITNNNLANINSQLMTTAELVPQGLILVDQQNRITFANSYAKKILFIEKDVRGESIENILMDERETFCHLPLKAQAEKEMLLKTSSGFKRYYVMVRTFIPTDCEELGELALITIKESAYAHKLSNSVAAAYSKFTFADIIGHSKKINDAINLAKIASKSTSTVLITGPSGTGKELFAHSIHSDSSRSDGPFISINCGALPANLVESELFGYEGGAFTGSRKDGQIGKFELANHGTIFLDEIGEMPLTVQASILRVIETKEVTRIGGSRPTPVDVRIIAATNRDLMEAIQEKLFREDLYYRLNILRIHIPPLCQRKSDIKLLVDKFTSMYTQQLKKTDITFTDSALRVLEEYDWPGNVRELENTIERIINICESNTEISEDLIQSFITIDQPNSRSSKKITQKITDKPLTHIKDAEKDLIINALTETNGSVTESAAIVGIGRRTFYRKCEEYGIDYNSYRK